MKIKNDHKIFERYMKPFLEAHGFVCKKRGTEEYVFRHQEYSEAVIVYRFFKYVTFIEVIIEGGIYPHLCILNLGMFVSGPLQFDEGFSRSLWHYKDDNTFLGMLEYHSKLFENWVFDWMLGKNYTEKNFYEIAKMHADEKAKRSSLMTDEQKQRLFEEVSQTNDAWKKTFFYPKNWKLDPDLINKE